MRTISKEFKIYEYAELSQNAKERVRNNYIENLDADIFTEQIMEDLREKGKRWRIEYNNFPMRPLGWLSPNEKLAEYKM